MIIIRVQADHTIYVYIKSKMSTKQYWFNFLYDNNIAASEQFHFGKDQDVVWVIVNIPNVSVQLCTGNITQKPPIHVCTFCSYTDLAWNRVTTCTWLWVFSV